MAVTYGTYTITDEMDGSQFWTTATAPAKPNYTFTISNLVGDGNADIKVGDIILYSYYRYTVTSVGETTVLAGNIQNLRGGSGLNNATVVLYKRGGSTPALPTGDVTYTFSSGIVANNLNGWTQEIPSGTDPLYSIRAVASSTSSTDKIPKTEWQPQTPVIVMENGTNGDDGYNQATLYLYQRKSGTAPSKPSSAMTYDFTNGSLTTLPSGWYRYIPNGTDPCYVTTAIARSQSTSVAVPASAWTDVVKLVSDGISPDPLTIVSTKYQEGSSNTIAPTGTWHDDPVAVAEGNYLWTKVTYSDNSYSYSVAKQGVSGSSVTVTSTVYAYQLSTSGTSVPTGNWSDDPVAPTDTQYAWTRTTTTFSDGSTAVTYTVGGKTGADGYTVILTNESHTFAAGTSAAISATATSNVVACKGVTQISCYVGSSASATSISTGITGLTCAISSNNSTSVKLTFTAATTLTTKSGTVTIPVHVDGKTFNKIFTFSLALTGQKGDSISITSTSIKYAKNTSGTAHPTTGWDTTIPTVGEGEYLWTQTIVNYSDSTKTESYSVSRNAVNGTNGTSPTVTTTVTEYVQSDSGTTTPTSGWNTTPPSATAGKYMWTKVTVTYSDGATAVSYTVSKNGTNGNNGVNNATVYLYKAGSSAPAVPTGDLTYTFSTKTISGSTLNNWQQTVPTPASGQVVYVIAATANSTATTDTISSSEWSAPLQLNGTNGTNGDDGLNQATIFLYKRGASVTKPSTTVTYTFATGALSAEPNSWKRNIPATDGTPCWVTTAVAIGTGTTASLTSNSWSTPTKLVEDGKDGVSVTNVTSTNNTQDGGTSEITVTLSDGSTKTFNVKNGNTGSTGATAEWYYGTDLIHTSDTATLPISATSGVVVGSMYLNPDTSLCYKCTAINSTNATWTYAGDLTTGVINNIEIGGRNIIINTLYPSTLSTDRPMIIGQEEATAASVGTLTTAVHGLRITNTGAQRTMFRFGHRERLNGLISNETYTFSFDASWKVLSGNTTQTTTYYMRACLYDDVTTAGTSAVDQYINFGTVAKANKGTEMSGRCEFTFTIPNGVTCASLYVYCSLATTSHYAAGDYIELRNIKLEKGNKATDWTPAPEDVDSAISDVQATADAALSQSVWYATCDTGASTVAKDATISPTTTAFELKEGAVVNVRFSVTNSGDPANLTLSINSTTAKPIKYINNNTIANIPGKGYILGGAVYQFVYDGQYWVIQNLNYNTDTNNVDRSLYAIDLAASAAISAGTIGVVGSDGKLKLLGTTSQDMSFKMSIPPLYVGTAYTAKHVTDGTKLKNNYSIWGTAFNLTNTHAIQGATATKPVYIVGTLSNDKTMFTPNSTVLTCTEPTSVDNLYYIRLGVMSTTANAVLEGDHPIYMYYNGKFQTVESAAKEQAATALESADGKNKNYYLASTSTPLNPSDGDNWFQIDNGFALYTYDSTQTNPWVKAGFGSAAFDTIDAGSVSVGYLNSLLIRNKIGTNPVDYDYWNLSSVNLTNDGFTFEGNTLKTSHLIAREDVDVYGGSGSRIYIPADTGYSVADGTDDAYIDLQEKGLIIQSNTSSENEYLTATLKTIYPSDGTTTYQKYVYDGQGQGISTVDYESVHSVYVATETGDMGSVYVDRYVPETETISGVVQRRNSSNEIIYDYGQKGSVIFSNKTVGENDKYITIGSLTSDYFEIERGELATYKYTYPAGSSLSGYTDYVQTFNHDTIRLTPTTIHLSHEVDDPHSSSGYQRALSSFYLNTYNKEISFEGDGDWSFYLNDTDLSFLSKREYAQASSSLSISSAWGWVTCLSLTLPANISSHTIIYKITGSVQFSTVAQSKAQVLSIYYNGDHHNRHIYSSSIGTTGCNWDITHFIEIVPNPSPTTIYLMAQCEVACSVTDRWFLAEAVYYKD